jgi:hypothetical protein
VKHTNRILYSLGNYYVIQTQRGHEVYKTEGTAAARVATISATDGFQRAIEYVRRQYALEAAQ